MWPPFKPLAYMNAVAQRTKYISTLQHRSYELVYADYKWYEFYVDGVVHRIYGEYQTLDENDIDDTHREMEMALNQVGYSTNVQFTKQPEIGTCCTDVLLYGGCLTKVLDM